MGDEFGPCCCTLANFEFSNFLSRPPKNCGGHFPGCLSLQFIYGSGDNW